MSTQGVIEMAIEQLYRTYKPLLFSIAYRMLGMVSDAEDIVQDVFLTVQKVDPHQVTNMKAYLCKMTTNRCIDLLKSTAKQREVYPGPWLPEPLFTENLTDPYEQLLQDDTISYAMLKLLHVLNPVERAVFILREAFSFEYADIANILDKSEANCRKLMSRAKQKLSPDRSYTKLHTQQSAKLVEQFIAAARSGNIEDLISVLAQDVILYTDGGGKVKAALKPIYGHERVIKFLVGVAGKLPSDITAHPAPINGQVGLLFTSNHRPHTAAIIALEEVKEEEHLIKRLYFVMNPDKLNMW